ncbi:hypothetical protein Leryth_027710 [Lithospermum erythrorhizon]|nr:hypothetical protein Leryth_027710 [Lithospermum erythrorhizon]
MTKTNMSLEIVHLQDEEEGRKQQQQTQKTSNKNASSYMLLLGINYFCLFVGSFSSSMLTRFYYIHKGNSRWVTTWIQCAGFPLLLFPIFLPYYLFKTTSRRPFSGFQPKIIFLSIIIGFMLGLNNLLISWGISYLPVSTNSLLLSSQLAFILVFSIIIVKQKVTFSNLNCVILLTLSSVLLALGSSHDKPDDVSRRQYFIGFFCTIGAGLLFSLYLPIVEKIYRNVTCYSMVMEMQLVMEIAATALATIPMVAWGGGSEMKKERFHVFNLGPNAYVATVAINVVTWQLCFMGTAGMVFLTSSLTGGICSTALLAMNVLGGVLIFKEAFVGAKIVSTLLCVWGFGSYIYGMYINNVKENPNGNTTEMVEMASHDH